MRREVIAAIVVGVAALGLALFSISQENARRYEASDSLVAINPIETPEGEGLAGYSEPAPTPAPVRRRSSYRPSYASLTLPAGSAVPIRIGTSLSSEQVRVGDSWSGVVTRSVYANGDLVVPAGTTVSGTVAAVRPAERGDRAMLQLGLARLHIGDRSYRVHGRSEPVIAGSPRARNVGAIAGGTAAGAILGKTVGGSNKGALIGGLLGGAVATGAVAKSKGWQAVIHDGATLTFTTSNSVAVSKRAVNNQMASR
jgi:hypothetical protein